VDTLIRVAAERGATLVTTLHQVDVATRFPRVVGLRGGVLAFDLPGREVTRERLAQLYAQHEHELTGPAPMVDDAPAAPAPVTMACR
jgi:phosphonate transport system ATP-binding protein